jgi:cytochrome P450
MTQPATIPKVPGFSLAHLLAFRDRRLEWQMWLMNEFGDICRTSLGPFFPVVLIGSAELAQAVLVEKAQQFVKSRGLQVTRPVLGNGLLTSEGDFHRRQRKLISPGLTHRRVGSYAGVMASYAEAAQETWKDGETIDVSAAMMKLTLAIAGKTMFDADLEGEASEIGEALTIANRTVSDQITSLLPAPLAWPLPRNWAAKKAIRRLEQTVYKMIADRRSSGQDPGDILSMLLLAEEEGSGSKMTDLEIRDEVMTLFLAGHETTANALAWTFYLLSRHPEVYGRLRAEVDTALGGRSPVFEDVPRLPYALAVLKESMRLYPPAYIIGREAACDVDIGPYRLPRKMTAFINVYGMHRRAKYFPDPERFDPDRFKPELEKQMRTTYLPFGGGPRVCIGNQFALLEGQLVLATLVQRVVFESASDRAVEAEPLITLRPRHGVPLVVRRRPAAPAKSEERQVLPTATVGSS